MPTSRGPVRTPFTPAGATGCLTLAAHRETPSSAWHAAQAGVVILSNSALEADRAPRAICFNVNCGVRRLPGDERAHSDDLLFDLVPTADGVLVPGITHRMPAQVKMICAPADNS